MFNQDSLVPLPNERFVVLLPLALEPHGRRREAFLSERIDCDDVVTTGGLAGLLNDWAKWASGQRIDQGIRGLL